jgi:UDP-N-acetylglucosamine--N-acetylmuramyl-(pentapeptide) pyrophosphoryl-undecaprenol N-acetylglucosamine transferase
MGARGGLEEKIVPRHSYRLAVLPSLKGGFLSLSGPRKAWRGLKGYFQARRIILSFGADAIVGLGGHASALPVLAGWGLEVPVLILEQNAIPGRTTRALARFADEVGVQFYESAKCFPNPRLVKLVGNPLRRKVLDAAAPFSARHSGEYKVPAEPTILVLGGSQGAKALNDLAVRAWPKIKQNIPGAQMIIVSGPDEERRVMQAFAAAGGRGRVLGFTEAMEDLYAQAHVVLARAGATTLAEIAAFALPSVLIPYPFAVDNHQVENAKLFVERGAGWMMLQQNVELDRLAQRLADAVLQPERHRKMAMAASALSTPRAGAEIISRLLALAQRKKAAGAQASLGMAKVA